ncbi:MAG TPA: helix-turn-helix transcriptional regulator [Candidatus Acidoferrales bacterium]|nr:helix-turn-helix transcriptional regulator [Candidatus Acidoferrales bacterium]
MIKQRLEELGLEQRDLAAAAKVTESYISQLLTRKKLPPAPDRTDIYKKMEKFLKLPDGNLSSLAEHQRREELRKSLGDPPAPLFKEVRELVLRKCAPGKEKQIRAIFERQPFGELERLITQKLLGVVKRVVKEELESENWLHLVARLSGRSYEQMRVILLEFLDTDVFHVTGENCVSFLDPLIESWDIDLVTFAMEIVLSRRLAPGDPKRFEFVEKEAEAPSEGEPGLREFLGDPSLSGDATEEEIEFLKRLRFKGKRPTPLYYYRELQGLRDPLHFRAFVMETSRTKTTGHSPPEGSIAPRQKGQKAANGLERQLPPDAKNTATRRWAGNKGGGARKEETKSQKTV